jgi:mannose-6-phosphate isomerase-like protein (cupin superfamily)/thiamine kinase-like enzyme
MKTVYKPWGKEEWLELNEHYCYKRIYINAGYRTSHQLHNEKLETNYIISGEAEVWLGDEIFQMGPGESFTVQPGTKHRVIAKTDLVLQEVSTPQVDDVIRFEDDTGRPDGLIKAEHLNPALCILTAGMGTRIEKYSKWTNKALLPIGDKASISYLIDGVPFHYDIVIALGHLGDQVKQYVEAAHYDRMQEGKIRFVQVHNYNGPGSGPGTSLKACENWLQRPFIWAVSDCYVEGVQLPPPDRNWVGISPTSMPEIYSTFDIDDEGKIWDFRDKDRMGYDWAFIGLCGVYEYERFWKHLDTTQVVDVFYYTDYIPPFVPVEFKWHDIGTLEGYQSLVAQTGTVSLDKNTTSFSYHVGNRFIKLFADSEECANKIERANFLGNLIPNLVFTDNNVFAYEWVEGITLYQAEYDDQLDFLEFMKANVWGYGGELRRSSFVEEKTKSRFPEAVDLDIPWDFIGHSWYTQLFHGDLQFDNVIYNPKTGAFTLIDWRGSFEGNFGDIYYDLGKLYGGLRIDYRSMKEGKLYKSEFLGAFEDWVEVNNYNIARIKWNTVAIWLSMIPLHPAPFSDILKTKAFELMAELQQ